MEIRGQFQSVIQEMMNLELLRLNNQQKSKNKSKEIDSNSKTSLRQ